MNDLIEPFPRSKQTSPNSFSDLFGQWVSNIFPPKRNHSIDCNPRNTNNAKADADRTRVRDNCAGVNFPFSNNKICRDKRYRKLSTLTQSTTCSSSSRSAFSVTDTCADTNSTNIHENETSRPPPLRILNLITPLETELVPRQKKVNVNNFFSFVSNRRNSVGDGDDSKINRREHFLRTLSDYSSISLKNPRSTISSKRECYNVVNDLITDIKPETTSQHSHNSTNSVNVSNESELNEDKIEPDTEKIEFKTDVRNKLAGHLSAKAKQKTRALPTSKKIKREDNTTVRADKSKLFDENVHKLCALRQYYSIYYRDTDKEKDTRATKTRSRRVTHAVSSSSRSSLSSSSLQTEYTLRRIHSFTLLHSIQEGEERIEVSRSA